MIRLSIFFIVLLIFACRSGITPNTPIDLIAKQDTIRMEVGIHDTVDYYLNDVLYLKIKEKLAANRQYNLNFRIKNVSLDSVHIIRMKSSNVVLDDYHIQTIAPQMEKKIGIRFYARAPVFSKELTIYLENRKSIIIIRGRGQKTEKNKR